MIVFKFTLNTVVVSQHMWCMHMCESLEIGENTKHTGETALISLGFVFTGISWRIGYHIFTRDLKVFLYFAAKTF